MSAPAWLADLSIPLSAGRTTTAGRELAREIKARWQQGERPDARAALRAHPELRESRSVALDLAYEEYCLRTERGEQVDTDTFCDRFSTLRHSLAKQIAVHLHLEGCSGALELTSGHWPQVGDAFLGFELVEELGRGGFARVFLAREAALGNRPVVVKITQQRSSEAEVLGRLRHRNVVPVYSVHHDEATAKSAVCMPYLGRATLFDVLDSAFAEAAPPRRSGVLLQVARQQSEPNTPDDGWQEADRLLARRSYVDGVVHLVAQVAEALNYTHSQGICHGDLKPSNILLGWDATPLLLDFNLSFDHHVSDSALGGTLPYMSPEQLQGTCLGRRDEVLVDIRSDVFSLAVILYELLTGKHPFGRVTWKGSVQQSAEHLLEQQHKGPRSLCGANPQVDPALARVIEKCLAVDPDDRLQSAAELAVALRWALTPAGRARRWISRHRRLTTAAASILVMFCLGAVGYVASLPPRSERCVHEALRAIAADDWQEAVASANLAIELDPENVQAYFLRGYAYQQLEQWSKAIDDFNCVEKMRKDGSGYASMAYCYGLWGWKAEAIHYYGQAITAGYATAAVFNNIGRHYSVRHNWPESERWLDKAIQVDPSLQPALQNRACLELKRSQQPGWSPDKGLAYIRQALRVGTRSTTLLLDAARLCAANPSADERYIQQALSYLREAVETGLHRLDVNVNDFPALEDNPEFESLQSRLQSGAKTHPVLYVDPVREPPRTCWSCIRAASTP